MESKRQKAHFTPEYIFSQLCVKVQLISLVNSFLSDSIKKTDIHTPLHLSNSKFTVEMSKKVLTCIADSGSRVAALPEE